MALAEAGKRNEVREYGKIADTPAAVKGLVAKLARKGHELRLCNDEADLAVTAFSDNSQRRSTTASWSLSR